MTNISCDICMDLIPLVRDGVASDDSRDAVLQHISTCPQCATLYEGTVPPPADHEMAMQKLIRKVQIFSAMLMMFGMIVGLALTAGSGVFYNVLIMPFVGALGYLIFRGKAAFLIPLLLTATHFLTNLLIPGREYLPPGQLLMWSAIYSGAALAGVIVSWLLHFAFRKEQ